MEEEGQEKGSGRKWRKGGTEGRNEEREKDREREGKEKDRKGGK